MSNKNYLNVNNPDRLHLYNDQISTLNDIAHKVNSFDYLTRRACY